MKIIYCGSSLVFCFTYFLFLQIACMCFDGFRLIKQEKQLQIFVVVVVQSLSHV